MAERFKVKRSKAKRSKTCEKVELSPRTVEGNLKNLSIAYNWWCKRCKVLHANPFEEVTPPKYDKTPPRIVRPDEREGLKRVVAAAMELATAVAVSGGQGHHWLPDRRIVSGNDGLPARWQNLLSE